MRFGSHRVLILYDRIRSEAIIWRFVLEGRHVAHEVAFLLYHFARLNFKSSSFQLSRNFILNTVPYSTPSPETDFCLIFFFFGQA